MKKNYPTGVGSKYFNWFGLSHVFMMILLLTIGGLQSVEAQKMEKLPGPIVVCPAHFEDQHSRMGVDQMAAKKAFTGTKKAATAELIVTYGPGAQANDEARAAFQFALDIWAEEIVSSVPIRIFAEFADLGPGVLASAGPTTIFRDFPGAPVANIFYPAALADALAGEDLDPEEEFDLVVNLGNGIPWYYGTDGNTPAGQFDFVTVALHEAGHGLGFFDGGSVSNGVGSLGFVDGTPGIFDTFHVDGEGNSVLDIPNPSAELADFYQSGDVFCNSPQAIAALGGVIPELFAPNPFQGGSSIAHWDEATFPAGDPNSLMSPQVGTAESNFNIGDITRGYFADMGWTIAGAAPIAVSPASLTQEINVGDIVRRELTITNVTDAPVTVNAGIDLSASVVELVDPASIVIQPSEAVVVEVQLNATGIAKGIYDEEVTFVTEGFDRTVTIPLSIRVLDGTEVPIVVVNPESYNETIDQFQVVTRDLSFENSGDEVLNYSITVNDANGEAQATFADKVNRSNETIRSGGLSVKNFGSGSSASGLASLVRANQNTYNAVASSLYATGFEDFELGNVDGQAGWFISAATEADDWEVTTTNAFEGAQHLRGVSDGLGGTRLAFSPTIVPGSQPFMVSSTRINLQGTGTTWEVIPQSPTAESVVTRVRFNADGSIDVLDGGASAFVPIEATIPEGYFDLRVIVDRDDAAMTVYFDDQLVYSGTAFASQIEQVVFLTPMETAGATLDIDNVEVTDGDENAFFLTVSPTAGTVPFGTTRVAQVKFDARSLTPGTYTASIDVTTDDPNNANITIPVTLNVSVPPTISVAPDALSAAVDVTVDTPPVKTETFTITNSGESTLDYNLSLGTTIFTPPTTDTTDALTSASVDLSNYGAGNTGTYSLKAAGKASSAAKASKNGIRLVSRAGMQLENARVFSDSIFYDTGVNIPDDYVGLDDGTAVAIAVKFDVESDFELTAVRNAYRTEALEEASIILEIIRGGATPDAGELLTSQVITITSADGIFLEEFLNASQSFTAGESFWVVHKYPAGIDFPQGSFETTSVRPDTYFFSSDGGASYTNLDSFAFLTRALSGGDEGNYITLEPSSGSVAPGASVEVSVSFDGSELANGTFETDILVNSNDPVTPTTPVATTFEVSGQVSGIEVSDELLTFNDVFIGNSGTRTFTITNTGLALLNVTDISSDNEDFVPELTSTVINGGEEQEITVTFSPSSVGSINGIITITSDADGGNTFELIVNGIGVDPPTAILDPFEVFESTETGTTIDTEITLRNEGSSPLTFSFPALTMAAALADPTANIARNAEIIDFSGYETPEKGMRDARVGARVSSSMGVDNEFGYSWIDSDEPGGPVFSFFDISAIGFDATDVLGADGTGEVALPFAFDFYENTYESIFVNSNGFLAFQLPENFTFFNGQIPEDEGINNIIAGLWADLEPQEFDGAVYIAAFTDAFVVQWSNVSVFFGPEDETVTFQIVLFGDGTIDVNYADVETAPFRNFSTVGIENSDATDGAQVAFNTPYIKDGLSLRFIRPEIPLTNFISDVTPISGVVPAGGSRAITVTLDATELEPDVYYDELTISSNAPDKSTGTSLIELTVTDIPRIASFTLINQRTNEEIGPLNEGDVIDLADYDGRNRFSVVANIGDVPVGSVVFDFKGQTGFQTENFAPYSLGGDNNGDFNRVFLPKRMNTITATPYSERNGNGEAGQPLTVNFEVIDSRPLLISDFVLINADTNEEIGPLNEGDVIDLADYRRNRFSIVANGGEERRPRSVVFDFNGNAGVQTENFIPFALAGDNDGDVNPVAFPLGSNTVTATPYSRRDGRGDAGEALTVNFTVVDSDAPEIVSLVLINAQTNEEIGILSDGNFIDLAEYDANSFSVIAMVGEVPAKSVVFDYNENNRFQTENFLPYALDGDRNGRVHPVEFALGTNTITATPYSKRNGRGDAGQSLTVVFEVIDTANGDTTESSTKVFPNPVVDVATFTLEGGGSQVLKGGLFNLTGYNLFGDFDFQIDDAGTGTLDMSSLSPGVYILKLKDSAGTLVTEVKVIKK